MHACFSESFQETFSSVSDGDIKVERMFSVMSLVFGDSVVFFVADGPGPELRRVSFLSHEEIDGVDLVGLSLMECWLIFGEEFFQLIGRHSENRIGFESAFEELGSEGTDVGREDGFDVGVFD